MPRPGGRRRRAGPLPDGRGFNRCTSLLACPQSWPRDSQQCLCQLHQALPCSRACQRCSRRAGDTPAAAQLLMRLQRHAHVSGHQRLCGGLLRLSISAHPAAPAAHPAANSSQLLRACSRLPIWPRAPPAVAATTCLLLLPPPASVQPAGSAAAADPPLLCRDAAARPPLLVLPCRQTAEMTGEPNGRGTSEASSNSSSAALPLSSTGDAAAPAPFTASLTPAPPPAAAVPPACRSCCRSAPPLPPPLLPWPAAAARAAACATTRAAASFACSSPKAYDRSRASTAQPVRRISSCVMHQAAGQGVALGSRAWTGACEAGWGGVGGRRAAGSARKRQRSSKRQRHACPHHHSRPAGHSRSP